MKAKENAGRKAAEYVNDGMIVGLGTGSTVYYTLMALGDKVKNGLKIQGIPTSEKTEEIAREVGIPITTFKSVESIDLTIDGADEVDADFNLIKGGGGALLREKIVASITKKYVVVVDDSKMADVFGKAFPLPVEVVKYGYEATKRQLKALGFEIEIKGSHDNYFRTDNGNYVFNCKFPGSLDNLNIMKPDGLSFLEALSYNINAIPGVVENGLFLKRANVVVIGTDNDAKVIEKP